jgi:two-component system LytT family sensor kinase
MKRSDALAACIALFAGLLVGWFDVEATGVQGPLLLFMIAAFSASLISRAPAWLLALAVVAGLPLAHLIAPFIGVGSGHLSLGMLIALLPVAIAAYAGRGTAYLIASAAGTLSLEHRYDDDHVPWQTRPASPAALLGISLVACAAVGVVPVYASNIARHQPFSWWITLIWQTSSFIAWSLGAPVLLRAWQRMHSGDAQGVSPRELTTHVGLLGLIASLHALALPVLTVALRVPLGEQGFEYAVKWALAAYLPLDTLTYCLVIGLGHASNAARRLRLANARESGVRGELAASRLASLQAQLQPHFLFNALNAATVLARRGDAERAGAVLTEIADLLRYVLRGSENLGNVGLIPLKDELAFAESYLAIEKERFPDRLRWTILPAVGTQSIHVPHLILQPLVENAVKHGVGGQTGLVTITIRTEMRDSSLVISVHDTGEKANGSTNGTGIGLANTRARLDSLYGDGASLTLGRDENNSGTVATIVMPVRAPA